MKRKNGFTLVEMLAVIILIAIISAIATVAITRTLKNAKKSTYKMIEKNLQSATETYLTDNSALIPPITTPNLSSVTVTLSTLISNEYLPPVKDPDKKDSTCDATLSTIIVTRNNNTENVDLSYKVCLVCSKYKTDGC